jgi:Protein of unknown function (DUF2924)
MALRSRKAPDGRGGVSGRADTVDRDADNATALSAFVSSPAALDRAQLLLQWRNHLGGTPPAHLPSWLLSRVLAYRLQAATFGDLAPSLQRKLKEAGEGASGPATAPFANRPPATREGDDLRPGATLAREWRGKLERVSVLEDGYAWNGNTYGSLSMIAKAITGTSWNGHRFFGLRSGRRSPGSMATSAGKAPASGAFERSEAAR